jgi:hypothetical protein
MAKKSATKDRIEEIELDPRGWERFERAIDAAVKSGPKRKAAKPPPERSAALKLK